YAVVELPAEQPVNRHAGELPRHVPQRHVDRRHRERDGAAHPDPEAVVSHLEPAAADLGRILPVEERLETPLDDRLDGERRLRPLRDALAQPDGAVVRLDAGERDVAVAIRVVRLRIPEWKGLDPRDRRHRRLRLLGLLEADPLVRLGGDRVQRLVDRPRALLGIRPARLVRVERRVDDTKRMAPVLRGPVLEREAAVRAVVADALLVPGPVVLLLGDAELVRRLDPWRGSLDDVAPLLAAARAARVEADHVPVLVLVDVHVAVAGRSDEVAAHRLDGQVEVPLEGVLVGALADVERPVALLEVRLEHARERLLDRALAEAPRDEREHARLEVRAAV